MLWNEYDLHVGEVIRLKPGSFSGQYYTVFIVNQDINLAEEIENLQLRLREMSNNYSWPEIESMRPCVLLRYMRTNCNCITRADDRVVSSTNLNLIRTFDIGDIQQLLCRRREEA